MRADGRNAFASCFASLLEDAGLQATQVVRQVNRGRPQDASWSVTAGLLSAWKTGRNVPSEANQDGFFRVVRLLTKCARDHAARGHAVGPLQDEVAWARLLREARAQAVVPDASEPGEVAAYLETLIGWLNSDSWPQDRRFESAARPVDQPVLAPAAIERKLRIKVQGVVGGQAVDADRLTEQCRRLVILGEPGSGKTWLAKRAARRCAEKALQDLTAGRTLDEIELPLYSTCSRLFSADGDPRQAAVSSALAQIGDLGGSRLTEAIHRFLADRTAPTLLVIDSLDEAHGSDDSLRQADRLPWRIVLTSRPSSWNRQLLMREGDDFHAIGELQPLRYPDDVEAFIQCWFVGGPEGSDLAMQIAQRPALQKAATVPLILAFYCILGGDQQLPYFRRDLYAKVISCMLTGRWRGSRLGSDCTPHVRDCLDWLRAWAFTGATCHPVSDIGAWEDDVPTDLGKSSEADENALDHVATPLGPPDVYTGIVMRRFIHRSIREHLVAEHVATMQVDQAAEILLPHVWYDRDWEYLGPAALAMHPQRDRILRALTCRAANSNDIPENLSVIDANWEFRGFLARLAVESRERDWSPEMTEMIGRARIELAQSGMIDDLGMTPLWETSNRSVRKALLRLLANQSQGRAAIRLAAAVVRFNPTGDEKRQTCEALIELTAATRDGWVAAKLAALVAQLDPSPDDKYRACQALLRLLNDQPDSSVVSAHLIDALIQVSPTADDKRQARHALLRLLNDQPDSSVVSAHLIDALIQVSPTADDKRQARHALLRLLNDQPDSSVVSAHLIDALIQLSPTADDKRRARHALLRLLTGEVGGALAAQLAGAVAQLDPVADDKRQARQALLGLLTGQVGGALAAQLAGAVAQLDPVADDKRQARQALLGLLTGQVGGALAAQLAGAVAQLDPVADDKCQARQALLTQLAAEPRSWVASKMVNLVVHLATTAKDKDRMCESMLDLLASGTSPAETLAAGVIRLCPNPVRKRQARAELIRRLDVAADMWEAASLVGLLIRLTPTIEDKRQACKALIGLLAGRAGLGGMDELVERVDLLDPSEEDKRRMCEGLIEQLVSETSDWAAEILATAAIRLCPPADCQRRGREALLRLLAGPLHDGMAGKLVPLVIQVSPTTADKRATREALLTLLIGQSDDQSAVGLARGILLLTPTLDERRHARDALMGSLAEPYSWSSFELINLIVKLTQTGEERRQVRENILERLSVAGNSNAIELVSLLVEISKTSEEKRQARVGLLGLLTNQPDGWNVIELSNGILQFDPDVMDQNLARKVLLKWLAVESHPKAAAGLICQLTQFHPVAADLTDWRSWVEPPDAELIAEARRNSRLISWLKVLPVLASLSSPSA